MAWLDDWAASGVTTGHQPIFRLPRVGPFINFYVRPGGKGRSLHPRLAGFRSDPSRDRSRGIHGGAPCYGPPRSATIPLSDPIALDETMSHTRMDDENADARLFPGVGRVV